VRVKNYELAWQFLSKLGRETAQARGLEVSFGDFEAQQDDATRRTAQTKYELPKVLVFCQ
jgi:hypothetical protein